MAKKILKKDEMKYDKSVKSEVKPLQAYALTEDLEVWNVNIEAVREQDVNARSMPKNMFLQLVENIKKRGSLESLPFCAMTDKGLELISGHHRVRAARKAELETLWVLVDVSKMPRDHLLSKQLSHNSIQGQDNVEIIDQIFSQIEDAEAKISAYIEPFKMKDSDMDVRLASKDLEIELDYRTVTLMFLPLQADVFKRAVEMLEMAEPNEVYLSTRDEYDTFAAATNLVSEKCDIRSTPTILAKMAEIVIERLKDGDDNQGVEDQSE